MLRVAGDERNHDRAWKTELLELSFQTGVLAREPNRQKIVGSRIVARSRAEIVSLGFDQRLDRLSLQYRAVREMLKLDKPRAFGHVSTHRLATFSASFGRNDEELQQLVRVLVAKNVSTDGMIATYRRHLTRNLGGNRCADSGGNDVLPAADRRTDAKSG